MDMRESINSFNHLEIDGYAFHQENSENNNEMRILNNENENGEEEN